MRILMPVALATVLLAGCQRPAPPDPERPPVPKAMARSLQQPLERAKAAQKTVDDAAAEREAKAEAAAQ